MTVEESRALAVAINSLRFNPDLSDTEVQSYEMALANMRDRTQEETELTPGGIANWIYRSVNPPDSEFEKTIRAVESALGFKLFVWQKTYIDCERFRYMGDTTARILRDLLDVSGKPIDYTRGIATPRQQFYRRELRKIKKKLDIAGIPTRTVYFSEREKRGCMLREIFSTDPEVESVKRARAIVEQAFVDEDCCTCKGYIPVDPHLPGFVSAFPECRHGGLAMEHCDKYEKKDKPLWLMQKEAEAALKEREG